MINITCLNAHGFASDARAVNFLSTLHDCDLGLASPDVLMLQETHLMVPATGADCNNSRLCFSFRSFIAQDRLATWNR